MREPSVRCRAADIVAFGAYKSSVRDEFHQDESWFSGQAKEEEPRLTDKVDLHDDDDPPVVSLVSFTANYGQDRWNLCTSMRAY